MSKSYIFTNKYFVITNPSLPCLPFPTVTNKQMKINKTRDLFLVPDYWNFFQIMFLKT